MNILSEPQVIGALTEQAGIPAKRDDSGFYEIVLGFLQFFVCGERV